MSTQTKCDRCGKTIPKSGEVKRRFIHKTYFAGKIIFDFYDFDEYERDIDLCAECNNSFIDWFNAGNAERKLKRKDADSE